MWILWQDFRLFIFFEKFAAENNRWKEENKFEEKIEFLCCRYIPLAVHSRRKGNCLRPTNERENNKRLNWHNKLLHFMVNCSYKKSEFWLSANDAGIQNFGIENSEKKWLLPVNIRLAYIEGRRKIVKINCVYSIEQRTWILNATK